MYLKNIAILSETHRAGGIKNIPDHGGNGSRSE